MPRPWTGDLFRKLTCALWPDSEPCGLYWARTRGAASVDIASRSPVARSGARGPRRMRRSG